MSTFSASHIVDEENPVFYEEEEAPTGAPVESLAESVAENTAKTEADNNTTDADMKADKTGQFVDIPHDVIDRTTNKHLVEELQNR